MHIQLQVEIVLEKKKFGALKKPTGNSILQLSATRAAYQYQRSATRATHQLSVTFSLNHFKLSAIMLQPRIKPRTTIRPRTPYGLDSAAFEDQVRHVGTALRKGSRLRAATFPIDAYPLTRPPIRTIIGPGKWPRKQCRKPRPYVSLGGP